MDLNAAPIAPIPAPVVTRNAKAAKPSKPTSKTGQKQTAKTAKKPAQKRAAKPSTVTGYHWRKNGAGWDIRKDVYVEENRVRRRKQPYVSHLSKSAFAEMKRQYKGAALDAAIARWIADHDR